MLENNLEVGPFTPQELDQVCQKLTAIKIPFEVLKDEATEKSEMKSDYANLVNKAEFRLETYLGQVFYLRLLQKDFTQTKEIFAEYGIATSPQENPPELNVDMSSVHRRSLEQKKLQALVAWAVFAVLMSFMIWKIF